MLLETERGYNTTFSDPGFQIAMPVFFAAHGFVATPLVDGLRVGGAVELAAVDAPPNFARAAAMRKRRGATCPTCPRRAARSGWAAARRRRIPFPSSAPSRRDPRIVLAFGHGHLGLTLSAATARHVAALVAGRPAERNLAPFGIERFQ